MLNLILFAMFVIWSISMTIVILVIAHNIFYTNNDSKIPGLLFNLFSAMFAYNIVTIVSFNIIRGSL